MESQKHRLIRYLNDSYASEIGGIESLKDLAAVTTDEQVKQAVLDHLAQTQSQAERLVARIQALGGVKSDPKGFINAAIAKGSGFVNMGHDHEDKQTQDLIKAYAFEHFEVGAYTSLYAYASAIGDYETASLAQELRAEEEAAAVRFERLIPQLAILALNKTEEFAPAPEKKSTARSLAPWLLVPGAALAFWGVSRLLQNAQNGDGDVAQNFQTARHPNPEPTMRLTPDITETVVIVDAVEMDDFVPAVTSYDLNSENRPVVAATSGAEEYRASSL